MAFPIEGLWRIPSNGGWVNIAMLPIYGTCLVFIGIINQCPWFYHRPIWLQSLVGAFFILAVELAAGYVINIRMGLLVWDYSHLPLNYKGQICVWFGVAWYLLMPFAVWFEDRVSLAYVLLMRHWGKPVSRRVLYDYTLRAVYRELFTGRDAGGMIVM